MVSFVRLFSGSREVTAQVEVFIRSGRYSPGSVRISYSGALGAPLQLGIDQRPVNSGSCDAAASAPLVRRAVARLPKKGGIPL